RIAPASARTFSGETRQTTAVTASRSLSMSQPGEEGGAPSFEGRHQQRSVEVAVAPLAGGLRDQTARMARGGVERAILAWIVLRAERVGRADLRSVQGLPQQSAEVLGFAKLDEASQRPVRIGRRRVDEDTRVLIPGISVDPFTNARCVVAAFECQLADEQVRQRVEHGITDTRIALVRIEVARVPPTPMPGHEHPIDLL